MISLTEQARVILEEFPKTNRKWIYCKKNRSEFCTADSARIDYDNYAFTFSNILVEKVSLKTILVTAMRNYCNMHELEFVEK